MLVLVVNTGSSSVKLSLLDSTDRLLDSAELYADSEGFDTSSLAATLAAWPAPNAVGHRVVHGGSEFSGPVRIDDTVLRQLTELTDLAPLHQPKALAGIEAVGALLPDVPAVACFDTAFHSGLPPEAATYAIPEQWRRLGIRRYGFHGLSHAYAGKRAANLIGRPYDELRIVTAHLGAGASLCAIRDGRSVDTTMGFTPLEGLVMATRSGSIDPGLIPWVQRHEQLSAAETLHALETRSGLQALAGTGDMREIQRRADDGDAPARLARDVYLHRLAGSIAAMAAAAGGLDLLVFTGGVGEHSAAVRQQAADRLAWTGLRIDRNRNEDASSEDTVDADISASGCPVLTVVVASREDLQIAGEVRALLVD